MKKLVDRHWFRRILEIIPGLLAWSLLLGPFILAPFYPTLVAYFILAFSLYWFTKALNMMRNLARSYPRLKSNMKIDWLERCDLASREPDELLNRLKQIYRRTHKRIDLYNYEEINNLKDHFDLIKDWRDVYQVVIVANYLEGYDILEPTFDALIDSNYPNDKIIVVLAGEERVEADFIERKKLIEKKYAGKFNALIYNLHTVKVGEVKGKGSNIYVAGRNLWKFLQKERPDILPENILVTTLDSDHIVHREYFPRLTYKYITDPNRDRKTYQPVPLLFNNIWDAPAINRVMAVSNSFFQMIDAMRPFRLRTFAAHAQSLKTLLVTDFWSNQTIVEDGHQYWRTYFAFNGDHEMVALFIPIYQDCVLADTTLKTFKNQYLQMQRWAWGISDFPYAVEKFIEHPEIPFGEKVLQLFRLFAGHFSWSTASFLLLFAWIPLLFNQTFQNTVLAHNVTYFSGIIMNLAWVGLIANIWVFFSLLPKKPAYLKKTRYLGMTLQWVLVPVVALFFSAVPALDSQTRLMIGKYLDNFWSTPKIRKNAVTK